RVGTAMLLRFANADVLPYDYVEYARTMRRYLGPIEDSISKHHWNAPTTSLRGAIDRLQQEGAAFNAERDSALAGTPSVAALKRTNQALLQVERALTRPSGLRTRPWFRNLIYVADENNGYANMALPSVGEAIRAADEALTRTEIQDLASHFDRAAEALSEARAAIRTR
ncbi:MAG: transferrin receptor-like dimerization domain-containing protein, partial [Deltaproteobacteria bacterium]